MEYQEGDINMADQKKGDKPLFRVRASTEPNSDFMTTIGAAWPFKEGTGYVLRLTHMPVNWDGTCILVPDAKDD